MAARDDMLDVLLDHAPDTDALDSNADRVPTTKRFKPHLFCVVCGDQAFGKPTHRLDDPSIVRFRIQFRRRVLRIVQSLFPSQRTSTIGKSVLVG